MTMRPTILFALVLVVLGSLPLSSAEAAKPLLHPLFSDAAVLQRDRPVALWGWTAAGATVTVTLSGEGLEAKPVTATAAADGRWQAAIGPFAAGGPYTLVVEGGGARAQAKDVLVGDVWLCAGQSNMEFPVAKALDFEREKAAADLPRIRQLRVPTVIAAAPQELVRIGWTRCSPGSVGGFTAVGYFMAKALHADLGVPIGIVHSSWGGTNGEAWAPESALAALPAEAAGLKEWRELVAGVEKQKATTGKEYPALLDDWLRANDPGTAAASPWSAAATVDTGDGWSAVRVPGPFAKGGLPADWRGTLWLRHTVMVPAELANQPASLVLGHINGQDTAWVDGRQIGQAEGWNVRSYQLPKGLAAGEHHLAVRVIDRNGNGALPDKPFLRIGSTDSGKELSLAGEWRIRRGAALDAVPPLPLRLGRGPTAIYNAMIAPLAPLTMRGVAWYQGENNVERAARYRDLLPALIGSWRAAFARPDLPFLIVSLANYKGRKDQPGDSPWAELREAQALAARTVPGTALAVTIDVGEAGDIHPKDKQSVGRRLALAAEAVAYGKAVEWSGPWYRAMTVEGATVRLTFDHLGGGLATSDGKPPVGFAIAGADRVFAWATARIDGDTVVLSAPTVGAPVAVRYAWASNPACTLVNKAGLPAVPFRTDDWQAPPAEPAK